MSKIGIAICFFVLGCAFSVIASPFWIKAQEGTPQSDEHRTVIGVDRGESLLFGVVGIETDSNQSRDINQDWYENGPMLIPKLSKTTANLLVVCACLGVISLCGAFIWLIYSSIAGIDERSAIVATKIGAAFGILVLNYPLVHVMLDLSDFHCVYLRDLL